MFQTDIFSTYEDLMLLPFSEIVLAFLIIPPNEVLCHLRFWLMDVAPSDGFGEGGRPVTELVRLACDISNQIKYGHKNWHDYFHFGARMTILTEIEPKNLPFL